MLKLPHVLSSVLFFLCLNSSFAFAEMIELTPQKVLELAAERSTEYQDSLIRLKQAEANFFKQNLKYKWDSSLNSGFTKSRLDVSATPTFLQSDRYRTDLSLSRSFLSGTLLGVTYSNTSLDSQYDSLTAPSSKSNQNLVTLSLEQGIFPYFFGSDDRALYNSALAELKAQSLDNLVGINNLRSEALQLFWDAYMAQANYSESTDIVERYDRLAKTVRRKSNFSYTGPGDLQQALIEYETRKQNKREDELSMLKAMNALKTYLGLHESDTLRLLANDDANLPSEFKGDIKSLLVYRFQESKTKSAQLAHEATAHATAPDINLVAKYSKGGLETGFDDSFREMSRDKKDETYVGFILRYTFDNESARKDSELKSLTAQNEEVKLSRKNDELKSQLEQAYARVHSGFENINVSKNVYSLREKVVTELTRTFNQGRTDISILIDAINKQSAAKVNLEKAVADFQIRRLEYLNLTTTSEE